MKPIRLKLSAEDGAAQMIEAALIYPIVFLCIFFLIYIGIYILQTMTVASYAQKVALLAAREIAYPGYSELVNSHKDAYTNAAIEADLKGGKSFSNKINILFDPGAVEARAYRFWKKNPLEGREEVFSGILNEMVNKNSILGAKGETETKIWADNYFVVQYVTVNVKQPLLDFAVLDFFGIESPVVETTVKASANDTDEFIRNTDFVVDALEMIANKLGIDVASIKEKVNEAKDKLGLS